MRLLPRDRSINLLSVWISAALILVGQTRPSFDIASVKANLTDDPFTDKVPHLSGNRVTMHNTYLFSMVTWAYGLKNPNYQLVMHPWEKEFYRSYDVEALAADAPADGDLRLMLQTLLEDRFKLKVHRETKELSGYDLVVSRSGSKLKVAQLGSRRSLGFGGSSSWVELGGDGNHLIGHGATIAELVVVLSGKLGAPVRDRTDLTGTYDYNLVFSGSVDITDAPILTTAINDLGLNLVKSKGLFDVLIVDSVAEPTKN